MARRPTPSKFSPEGTIWLLEQVRWSYFITILLPHRGIGDEKASAIWKGFRGRLAKELGIPSSQLLTAAAFERGPRGENPHLHALISGRFWRTMNPDQFIETTTRIGSLMSLPDVETSVFESRRSAASYICKESINPGHRYFQDGRWPMISDSVVEALRRKSNRR